jgi:hypothetical protein
MSGVSAYFDPHKSPVEAGVAAYFDPHKFLCRSWLASDDGLTGALKGTVGPLSLANQLLQFYVMPDNSIYLITAFSYHPRLSADTHK